MSKVYSTQFAIAAGASGPVRYQVPAGYVGVLRDVWVYCGSDVLPQNFYLEGSIGQKMWGILNPPLTPAFFFWQGRQVFNELEYMTLAVLSGNVDVSMSGYLLSLP